MKLSIYRAAALIAAAATLATACMAQSGQDIVNRRINEMVIDRAILKQATHGKRKGKHKASVKRSAKRSASHSAGASKAGKSTKK